MLNEMLKAVKRQPIAIKLSIPKEEVENFIGYNGTKVLINKILILYYIYFYVLGCSQGVFYEGGQQGEDRISWNGDSRLWLIF
jgi:hypothetical protein